MSKNRVRRIPASRVRLAEVEPSVNRHDFEQYHALNGLSHGAWRRQGGIGARRIARL